MRSKNPTVSNRLFIAFSDIAILAALRNHPMTGYGINQHFILKVGHTASPSTIYSAIATIEREGLIKCIKNMNGRVYVLTDEGKESLKNISNLIEESKHFMHRLLT